jgi:hypothetical protein
MTASMFWTIFLTLVLPCGLVFAAFLFGSSPLAVACNAAATIAVALGATVKVLADGRAEEAAVRQHTAASVDTDAQAA